LAADRLIAHRRPAAVIELVAGQHAADIPTRLIVTAIEALVSDPSAPTTATFLAGEHPVWPVEQVFLELDRRGDIDDDEIATLEFPLLGILLESPRSARAFYRQVGERPGAFVDLLTAAYREERDDVGASARESATETKPAQAGADERHRNIAHAAWRILEEWRGFPGDGGPPGERDHRIEHWAATVLTLAAEASRGGVACEQVGRVLARVPAATDGAWPCLAARRLLEASKYDALGLAIARALYFGRGMHSRRAGEGGRQERELCAKYRGFAETLRRDWPRTANMLELLADTYEREAEQQDAQGRTTRRRWGIDLEASTLPEPNDASRASVVREDGEPGADVES
jgi:hypothetical protein